MSDGEMVELEQKADQEEALPAEATDRSRLPSGMLEPVADPGEIVQARTERSEMIADALEEGRDYGSVQGIPKPFLQKPGAERLTDAFGCYPRFRIVDQEVDHDRTVEWEKRSGDTGKSRGLYRYVVSCDLVHRASGIVVGNGLGVCSSMEDKYVESPRNSENTIAKMAKKRAHVDAALSTFGLSEMFTQDPDAVQNGGGSSQEFSPDNTIGFGKHSGLTYREVVEEDEGYAEWLAEDADRCPQEAKDWLQKALEGGEGLSARGLAQQAFLDTLETYGTDADEPVEVAKAFASWWAELNKNVSSDLSEWDAARFNEAAEKLDEGGAEMLTQVRKWAFENDAEQGDFTEEVDG